MIGLQRNASPKAAKGSNIHYIQCEVTKADSVKVRPTDGHCVSVALAAIHTHSRILMADSRTGGCEASSRDHGWESRRPVQ